MADDKRGGFEPPPAAWVGATCSVAISFALLWYVVPYGMFPHDEGQYGQSATRILDGELPHRDFHEMYSGGLSYWHALLFRLFGKELIVLRRALVCLAMPAVLAAYAISLRFTRMSLLAGVVAVASVFAMIGSNHAATPTTYLAILSLVVVWLLIKDTEAGDIRWLVLAGILCGFALTIKITGLYTLAATGLVITFRGTPGVTAPWAGGRAIERVYRGAVAAIALAAGPLLVAAHPTANTLAYFCLPTTAVALTLPFAGRPFDPRTMLWRHVVLVTGTALPVVLFMVPWVRAGAVGELYEGLFVMPRVRLGSAAYFPPTALVAGILAVPLVCTCMPVGRGAVRGIVAWLGVTAVVGLLAVGLTAAPRSMLAGNSMRLALEGWRWFPAVGFPLAAILFACRAKSRPLDGCPAYPALAMAALVALNQYPYSSPVYFFFCSPTTMLSALAIAWLATGHGRDMTSSPDSGFPSTSLPIPRAGTLPTIVAIVALACFCLIRFGKQGLLAEFHPQVGVEENSTLSGLIVPRWLFDEYQTLRALLDTELRHDQTIFAGPDCPDVYFFTGRRNPTSTMYDIFAAGPIDPQLTPTIAQRDEIGAVVMNMVPQFSKPWSDDTRRCLEQRMGLRAQIGRFVVYLKPTQE